MLLGIDEIANQLENPFPHLPLHAMVSYFASDAEMWVRHGPTQSEACMLSLGYKPLSLPLWPASIISNNLSSTSSSIPISTCGRIWKQEKNIAAVLETARREFSGKSDRIGDISRNFQLDAEPAMLQQEHQSLLSHDMPWHFKFSSLPECWSISCCLHGRPACVLIRASDVLVLDQGDHNDKERKCVRSLVILPAIFPRTLTYTKLTNIYILSYSLLNKEKRIVYSMYKMNPGKCGYYECTKWGSHSMYKVKSFHFIYITLIAEMSKYPGIILQLHYH